MGCHQGNGFGIAVLHYRAHGAVDAVGDGVGNVTAGHQIAAQKNLLVAGFQGKGAQVTHAKAGDHLTGHRSHLLNIAAGTGGDFGMTKDHIFSGATA